MSVLECAWFVMGETWSPGLLPIGVGLGVGGSVLCPSVGIGLGIGTGLQYFVAITFCEYKDCVTWGTIDSCGKCK
ncbi:MAG: hypothetical protein GWN55_16425 [Phycisphaerae bacterium]|nr:hypothetical protein [Phycisphaerae bacterium]NIS54680.1 hypothetical protein [Phycisphaerae bacterium]NIU12271.1 hypothetical protein [Phycisphaerae bacterium]NIV02879.1 hypothetical protein [Phycisphaerae bacterium]NIX02557.1 hypothetical protein [Phycisphaerae bacterium]